MMGRGGAWDVPWGLGPTHWACPARRPVTLHFLQSMQVEPVPPASGVLGNGWLE